MAIKHLISPGIGFSPGSGKFIITRGLIAGEAIIPIAVIPTSGGAVNVKSQKTHKPLTEDEARGLDAIGRAMMGLPAIEAIEDVIIEQVEKPEEIEEFIEDDGNYLFSENISSLLLPNYGKSINEQIENKEDKIDDDILLILAIITVHNS